MGVIADKDLRMVGIGLVMSPVMFMVYEVFQIIQHLHLDNQTLFNSDLMSIATKMWAVVPTMLIGVALIVYFDRKIRKNNDKKTSQIEDKIDELYKKIDGLKLNADINVKLEQIENKIVDGIYAGKIENLQLQLSELKLDLIAKRQHIGKKALKNDYETIFSRIELKVREIESEVGKKSQHKV